MHRPTGLNVLLYLRKSRKDIEEEKKALEEGRPIDVLKRHREQLLELARLERHNVIDILEEVVSGEYIIDRPKVQELLRRVESGEVDAVLVMDIDRIGRGDMFDSGYIYRTFKFSETLIITPSEVIDPNEEGAELLFGIKSMFAREELKGITRRLQRGRRASAKEGKSITNRVPYGYRRGDDLKLYPDPETAWVVKKIFEMIADGMGRIAVARYLDAAGIKPPLGRDHWNQTTISCIIKNEVYLGRIIWGQRKFIKLANGKYKIKLLPREQWIIKENAHEPLVSEELFYRANQVSSARWRPPTVETKKLANPLAGILVCAVCGRAMLYQPCKNRPTDRIRCVNPGCQGIQKGATFQVVEQRVLEGLKQFVVQLEENMMTEKKDDSVIPIKRKALERRMKELEELHNQKNNLHDLLEKGIYDIPTFLERQKIVGEKIKETEEAIEKLKQELNEEEEQEQNRQQLIPQIRSVLEAYYSTDDVEKKNRLLKSVLEKATFLRKKEWIKQDQFVIQLYPRLRRYPG